MTSSRLIQTAMIICAVVALSGCAGSSEKSAAKEARKGAGHLIDQARTPSARGILEDARDEENAEMRRIARELDEKIQQLREENAALERKLTE